MADAEVRAFLLERTTELSRDVDALFHWATRLGGRYMGEDRAEAFDRRNAVPTELLVRVTPARIVGRVGIED
jgi:hypothetical protein